MKNLIYAIGVGAMLLVFTAETPGFLERFKNYREKPFESFGGYIFGTPFSAISYDIDGDTFPEVIEFYSPSEKKIWMDLNDNDKVEEEEIFNRDIT